MQTERLLDVLTADLPRTSRSLSMRIGAVVAMASITVGLGFFALYGGRDEGFETLGLVRFIAKLTLLVSLVIGLWYVVNRAGRPVKLTARDLRPLGLVLVLWALVIGAEAWLSPRELWPILMWGQNYELCLQAVPAMGLPILIALLFVLRNAAPAEPIVAGALCGLFSGAVAGMIYALHCPDDSSFFVVVWYGLGMACLTALGCLMARRFLQW